MKKSATWVSVAVAAALLAGCGGADEPAAGGASDNPLNALLPEAIRDAGRLNVGNSPVYPPMSYLPEGTEDREKRQGFDVDLARALGEKLGVTVTFVTQEYEQYIPSLATGRIDLIQSAMQDLESRRETVDFVDYYTTGPQLFTRADKAAQFPTEADVCGQKVAVDSGDTGYRNALAEFNAKVCAPAGKPPTQELTTNGTADALLQLQQGRADVSIRGAESIRYVTKEQEPGKYALIGKPIAEIPVGIGVKKGNTELRDAVAAALKTLIEDGTYAKIGEKWGLADILRPSVTVNGQPAA
ncbi:amino acid ABC transporter substrate-binding protein, PAAT family [Micromonospora pallida]|uniref:Amino acid ABC transporter substrate-binding protein, PAAT family n=1 Tax=Micromonospora pallida TaxID=145854 RepID=A0A1C6S0W2_9ACTN|nr:ABC transporter substrate-binding protein [Micromonospora pallida]SCL23034.1 amino acid ABC transporter substrate-binding protein, PAAT family [Micromonospora pallida]